MASSSSQVLAAFQAGSGISSAIAHDVLAVVLAALALTWLAWTASGVGMKALDGRLKQHKALWYLARAAVIAMVVVFYLVR
jgi:integrating conjugative element protein (TIGR03758 family)